MCVWVFVESALILVCACGLASRKPHCMERAGVTVAYSVRDDRGDCHRVVGTTSGNVLRNEHIGYNGGRQIYAGKNLNAAKARHTKGAIVFADSQVPNQTAWLLISHSVLTNLRPPPNWT